MSVLNYDGTHPMTGQAIAKGVVCDGCGLGTTNEHIARRLARLESTTRFRPIHIQAVFLSAQSPTSEAAFLYSGQAGFEGERAALLKALQIETAGRETDAVLSEFQRKGYFLTHVLECVSEDSSDYVRMSKSLGQKLPSVLRRLRTSLKPKKVFVVSAEMAAICKELKAAQLGAELVLDSDAPFDLSDAQSVNRLRSRL